MVFRNISAEFLEETVVLPDGKPLVAKLLLKYPPEVDAVQLQKILKSHWKCKLTKTLKLNHLPSLFNFFRCNFSVFIG